MTIKKQIGSCIDQLRKMLGDTNNELSSEQRSNLKKGVQNLKKLQKAKDLTHEDLFNVVSEIAQTALEILESRSGK
jgi:ABC-type transporter Mla subunit MlaD